MWILLPRASASAVRWEFLIDMSKSCIAKMTAKKSETHLWKQCQIIDDNYPCFLGDQVSWVSTQSSHKLSLKDSFIHKQYNLILIISLEKLPSPEKKQRVIKRKKHYPLPTRKFMTLELPKPKQTHKEGDSLSQKVICSTWVCITTHPPHFERMPSH